MTKPKFWEVGIFAAFGIFLVAFPKKFFALMRSIRRIFIRFKQDSDE